MTSIVEQRMLSVFDLVEEPRDELYRRLIIWCGGHCATALLVVRDVDDLSEESANILKRLEDNLTTVERSSQWPETVLVSSNDTALVYRYRLTPQTVELFCTLVDGLYEWAEPNRPDDLCFTRADGSPCCGASTTVYISVSSSGSTKTLWTGPFDEIEMPSTSV